MVRYVRAAAWIAMMAALPVAASAYPAAKGASKDCMTCHKLDKKDAEGIIKKLNPALAVVDVKLAPVKGMFLIEIDGGEGKRGAVFLDFAKQHIVVLNQLIPTESLVTRKVEYSRLPLKDAVVLGDAAAKKKAAVFTDPDCPYCRSLHEEMKKAVQKRKDIAFHVFLYPLPMHKEAYKKAQAVLCERSLALLDDAFSGKAMPEPACGNEQLEKNLALGRELGFSGTPSLVREDGTVLGGTLPADKLIDWIDGK